MRVFGHGGILDIDITAGLMNSRVLMRSFGVPGSAGKPKQLTIARARAAPNADGPEPASAHDSTGSFIDQIDGRMADDGRSAKAERKKVTKGWLPVDLDKATEAGPPRQGEGCA